MYRPFVRVRGIDCVALALWLASGVFFLAVTASTERKASFATATVLVGLMAAAVSVVAAICRAEERVSDQMTLQHRAQQSGEGGPPRLASIR